MTKGEKVFNVVVSVAVVLTGTGFGAFTGFVYSEERYWWVGLLAGAVVAFPLAKFYLWQLVKAFKQGRYVWLRGTLVAVVSGIICTTIVHGIMGLIVYPDFPFSGGDFPLSWTSIIVTGEIIGAGTGLIIGAVLSGLYIAIKKGQIREAV